MIEVTSNNITNDFILSIIVIHYQYVKYVRITRQRPWALDMFSEKMWQARRAKSERENSTFVILPMI